MDQNFSDRIFLIDFGNFSDFWGFFCCQCFFLERETGEGSEMSGDLPKKKQALQMAEHIRFYNASYFVSALRNRVGFHVVA